MVNVEVKNKYECGNCGNEYDDEISAEECCPNESVLIEKYVCGECKSEHDDEEDAEDCCSKMRD